MNASVFVVPGEPGCRVSGKFSPGFVCLQVDTFVLQGAPESLDEDVVFGTSFAVHADFYVPGFENVRERFAGELAPLVEVEDFRGSVFEQGLLGRVSTEVGIQGVVYPPREHLSGCPVPHPGLLHVELVDPAHQLQIARTQT